MTGGPLRVTVWSEGRHEQHEPEVAQRYPAGIHGTLARAIETAMPQAHVEHRTLDDPDAGLSAELLDATDVLVWWGHIAHHEVPDRVVDAVHHRVLGGMGLVALHSAHLSRIFVRLMGTTCNLRWRAGHDRELVWTVRPGHPIAHGVPSPLVIEEQEMYGEYFDIPEPEELIFISSFTGGEVFRSGCTFTRGLGRIFYFSPGDQDYPVYHHPDVRTVITNGVRWVAPGGRSDVPELAQAREGWFERR